MRFTTPSPSSRFNRSAITGCDRWSSRAQCSSAAVTAKPPSESRATVVTRADSAADGRAPGDRDLARRERLIAQHRGERAGPPASNRRASRRTGQPWSPPPTRGKRHPVGQGQALELTIENSTPPKGKSTQSLQNLIALAVKAADEHQRGNLRSALLAMTPCPQPTFAVKPGNNGDVRMMIGDNLKNEKIWAGHADNLPIEVSMPPGDAILIAAQTNGKIDGAAIQKAATELEQSASIWALRDLGACLTASPDILDRLAPPGRPNETMNHIRFYRYTELDTIVKYNEVLTRKGLRNAQPAETHA